MENNINLDGLELTKVDSSSDDDKEEEYIAHLPPLPPIMTKVGNTNRSLSVKSNSVATMSNRKRLKTSNSIGSTKDLKKLLVGKKKILNTNKTNIICQIFLRKIIKISFVKKSEKKTYMCICCM